MTAIVTKRLMLKHHSNQLHNIITMSQWLNDADVVKYSEQRHQKHTKDTQLKYVYERGRHFREIHTSDAFIGTIAAHVDENNSVANVGILIGEKKEWGKGYGTEAWQAFCDHLLAHGTRKIEAGCMGINYGMIRIFMKTGMHAEGSRSGHFQIVNGDYGDYGVMDVDLVQWARFL